MAETDDFINNLREINEELQVFSRAINSTSRVIDVQEQQAAATGRQTRATNDQTAAAQRNAAAERALTDTTNQLNSGFKLLKDVLGKAVSVGGQFADTILNVSEKTTKFTAVMNSASVAAAELAAQFGRTGKAMGAFIKVLAARTEQQFEFIQASLDAKDSLAKFGANVSMTTDELIILANEAERTMEEFSKIGKPLSSLNTGILALGTTASEGAKSFLSLSDVTDKQRNKMRSLGISFEELTQGQADYIAAMAKGGRIFSQTELSQGKVREASLKYLATLQALSDITGKNVEQAKEEYAQVQGTIQMSIINNQLTVKRKDLERERAEAERAGDIKRRDALDNQIADTVRQQESFKNLGDTFMKLGQSDIAGALQTFFTTGAMKPEMVQRFAGVDLAKYKNQFDKGDLDEEALLAEFFDRAQTRINAFGTAMLLSENATETATAVGLNQEMIKRGTVAAEAGGGAAYARSMGVAVEKRTGEPPSDRFTDRRNTVLEDQLASRIRQERDLYLNIENGLEAWKELTVIGTTITDVFSKFMVVLDSGTSKIRAMLGLTGPAATAGGSVAAIGGMAAGSTMTGGARLTSAGAAGVGGNAGLPVTGVGAKEPEAHGQTGRGLPKLTTVSSKTGKSTSVNAEHADKFQSLIDYLDNSGYKINDLGGFVDRDVRGKPGVRSVHAHGGAIDINSQDNPMSSELITNLPEEIGEVAKSLGLGWGGNWRTTKDPMHFSIAKHEGGTVQLAKGGVAMGPKSGYPATLHGNEMVVPLNPNSILAELGKKSSNETTNDVRTIQTSMTESIKDMSVSNKVLMDMISTKLDNMISKLDAGNDTRAKILRHTYT
jgi:hypothetical protein